MKIGEKLKTLRTSKGYTPDIVSEKIGVSKTTYGRYERNESTPDINILENIANLYELEMFELLSDDKIILTQNNKKGSNNGFVINHLSEKLQEQNDIIIAEKDKIITEKDIRLAEKEERIQELKEIIAELKKK
jgi:transcriptional regulator with XRE-family HTH domain